MDRRYWGSRLAPDIINDRIRELNHHLHAVVKWQEVPKDCSCAVLVKDNINVRGFRTTAGSFALKELKPSEDAFCIKALRKAGALPFGKTTLSELAGFVSTNLPPGYSELGGQGINPIDERFTPGGSSSGSAIAVAAGLCDSAVGTETHGSLMFPALSCGVVGFKPSVGLISREGIVPISHSLDTPGALARSVREAVRLTEAMRGADPDDKATLDCPVGNLMDGLGDSSEAIRIVFCKDEEALADPLYKQKLTHLFAVARMAGIEFIEVPAPAVQTHYRTISSVEIQNDFDRFLLKYGNGSTPADFKSLVQLYEMRLPHHPYGIDRLTASLSFDPDTAASAYRKALQSGIAACTAVIDRLLKENQAQAIATTRFLPWWAVGRAPSLALPFDERSDRKPLGLVIGARRFEDRTVCNIAKRIENAVQKTGQKSK